MYACRSIQVGRRRGRVACAQRNVSGPSAGGEESGAVPLDGLLIYEVKVRYLAGPRGARLDFGDLNRMEKSLPVMVSSENFELVSLFVWISHDAVVGPGCWRC